MRVFRRAQQVIKLCLTLALENFATSICSTVDNVASRLSEGLFASFESCVAVGVALGLTGVARCNDKNCRIVIFFLLFFFFLARCECV